MKFTRQFKITLFVIMGVVIVFGLIANQYLELRSLEVVQKEINILNTRPKTVYVTITPKPTTTPTPKVEKLTKPVVKTITKPATDSAK